MSESSVPVEILGLFFDQPSASSIVLLGERNEVTHVLPIFIGSAEAQAIAIALQGIATPRPLTHDLMVNMLALLDARLDQLIVTDLQDGTFLAELTIEMTDGPRTLSCRPSDGIALAVRLGVPVLVERSVLSEAAVEVQHDLDQPFDEDEIESIVNEFQQFLETTDPSDFELDEEE